jgi:phenylalanyl-tRNA synthetase beta chain
MRDALADQNYLELCPLSLIGNDLLKKCSIETEGGTEIENPLGAETGILAPYTLPALLEHAENNMLIAGDVLRTFFESVVFKDNKDDHREIGMLVAAKSKTDLKTDPFLIAKQDLEEALGDAGYALSIDLCKDIPPFAHSGRCANLLVGEEVVGTIFEVHPDVRGRFDIPGRAAAVQLNLTKVLDRDPTASVFQELPTFPAVSYDTTVAMSADKKAGDLLNKIENSSDLLESVEIADLYGEGDSYNLTLRCTYRAADRTLKEEEAKQAFASVETLLLS